MKNIRTMVTIMAAAALMAMVSCTEKVEDTVEYLEVNKTNMAGSWQLVEWNGAGLDESTYMYINFIRNDETYQMWQNIDSFTEVPRKITGSFYIYTDTGGNAVIRGNYDHDSGDWTHRYIVKDLTAGTMTWIASDDETFVQKFVRVDSIPFE